MRTVITRGMMPEAVFVNKVPIETVGKVATT